MSKLATSQEQEVEKNFSAFTSMLDELMGQNNGRWALLRHGALIEIFDTVSDAHVAAWKLFSDGLFSVQEITKQSVDLGFYSYAGYQRAP